MENQRLSYLLHRYAQGQLTANEQEELKEYSCNTGTATQFRQQLAEMMERSESETVVDRQEWDKILEGILTADNVRKPPVTVVSMIQRYWVAASGLLVLGVCSYLLLNKKDNEKQLPDIAAVTQQIITPGEEGAILTLADGTRIVLDSLRNGIVATQNGTSVKLTNGVLAYEAVEESAGIEVYNTMQTPVGRQFQLLLPDGSRVWLNAGSLIRYPAVFKGKERKVEVEGEVFFEVASMKDKPFKVSVNGKTTIEVLGTQFNVNAYSDEEGISTTLFQGAINVADSDTGRIRLKPGQHLVQRAPRKVHVVKQLSAQELQRVSAWKDGYFNFEGLHFSQVMHQLERWYNIKVSYENGIPDISFWGKMERALPLESLLQMLKGSRLRFRMEAGRRLVIIN